MSEIIRIMAFFCILMGSTGMGYWYINRYKSRIAQTDQLLEIFINLRQEINYSCIPMAEVCRELEQRVKEPYHELLNQFYQRIIQQEGENISALWNEEVKKIEKKLLLSKDVLGVLYQLMDPMGYASPDMQIKKLDIQIEKLQEDLYKQKENQENKIRIYFSFGIMGGLLLGILFL